MQYDLLFLNYLFITTIYYL